MDNGKSHQLFFSRQDNHKLVRDVVACLELGHKAPEELAEYWYRKEFHMSHLEFDKIPSKRLEKDIIIMNLINEYQNGRGSKN